MDRNNDNFFENQKIPNNVLIPRKLIHHVGNSCEGGKKAIFDHFVLTNSCNKNVFKHTLSVKWNPSRNERAKTMPLTP